MANKPPVEEIPQVILKNDEQTLRRLTRRFRRKPGGRYAVGNDHRVSCKDYEVSDSRVWRRAIKEKILDKDLRDSLKLEE